MNLDAESLSARDDHSMNEIPIDVSHRLLNNISSELSQINPKPKISGRSINKSSDSQEKSIVLEVSRKLLSNKISERSNTGEDKKSDSLTNEKMNESI